MDSFMKDDISNGGFGHQPFDVMYTPRQPSWSPARISTLTPRPSFSSIPEPSTLKGHKAIRNITPPDDRPDVPKYQTEELQRPVEQAKAHIERFLRYRATGDVQPLEVDRSYVERPVAIKMSLKDFFAVEKSFRAMTDSQRYPSLCYNAATSTLYIQCMPSPVHETFVSTVGDSFKAAFFSLPDEYQLQVGSPTGEDYKAFDGPYEGSRKRPDLAIRCMDNAGMWGNRLVLEVGFSETYEHMVDTAKLWLEGTSSVSICLLINVLEVPNYYNPLKVMSDEEVEDLLLPEAKGLAHRAFLLPPNRYGPATFHGFNWAGEITSARLEVWRKNGLGKAYLHGPATDILHGANPSLSFRVCDFIPQIPQQHDSEIKFNWNICRLKLKDHIQILAKDRYQEALQERFQRSDDLRDGDYVP